MMSVKTVVALSVVGIAVGCRLDASLVQRVYEDPQVLKLSCKGNVSSAVEVRYTVNGKDPSGADGMVYSPRGIKLTPRGGNGWGGYNIKAQAVVPGAEVHDFRYAINGLKDRQPVETQTCNTAGPQRQDCGYDGITQGQCEAKGCCWGPIQNNPSNYPWCYVQGGPGPSPGPSPSPPGPPPTMNGSSVMIQVFTWNSASHGGWYNVIKSNAGAIRASFDFAWFPPPANSEDKNGYIPVQLNNINNAYGSTNDLKAAISAISPCNAVSDIVINHRGGSSDWGDFTNPSFGDSHGIYHAIANGDEGFSQSPSSDPMHNAPMSNRGAADTGENYQAARDEDHTNGQVQSDIINWMQTLKGLGFKGWRYDFVKGYAGSYVGMYDSKTNPTYSVGEYWDGNQQNVANWVASTGHRSMAFDYPLKYALNDAMNNNNMGKLAYGYGALRPEDVVTFVENHDTAAPQNLAPMNVGKVYLAYVYILTHPGHPSVFWDHFFNNVGGGHHYGKNNINGVTPTNMKQHIQGLIYIRQHFSLNFKSSVNVHLRNGNEYAADIDGKVYVKIGSGTSYQPPGGKSIAYSGDSFCLWA